MRASVVRRVPFGTRKTPVTFRVAANRGCPVTALPPVTCAAPGAVRRPAARAARQPGVHARPHGSRSADLHRSKAADIAATAWEHPRGSAHTRRSRGAIGPAREGTFDRDEWAHEHCGAVHPCRRCRGTDLWGGGGV